MEERIVDKDELRGVKKKRTDGEEDVVDINTTDADLPEEEAEYSVEFDGEYDEDLVGLTPTQLKEELERRERLREEAHAEAVRYLATGEEAFEKGDFARAERDFRDALSYEFSEQTQERLFAAVTDNYTNAQRLLLAENAQDFAAAEPDVRGRVLSVFGDALRTERAQAEEEAAPLRERVAAGQEERRAPFAQNRRYYLARFLVFLAAFAVFAVGIAVSASFLLRTQSPVPTILTAVFGVLTFLALVGLLVFTRKLVVAVRLCRDNERLSSTGEGARLQALEERLASLALVLDGEPEQPDPDEA